MPDVSSARQPAREQPKSKPAWSWHRFIRNTILIGGGVFLIGYFVVENAIPNLVPKNFGVVSEGKVYRSGELTTNALRSVIETHGIRTIVDFGAHDRDPPGELREQSTADLLGVDRVVLNLEGDATGNPNRYVEALRIMNDPAAQPVLVHCAAGAQRTGCAVALYRSIIDGWDDERALVEAEDYRHDPEDNPRMREMFHTWKDAVERALATGGAIDTESGTTPGEGG